MQMQKLKGIITRREGKTLVVKADKGAIEYRFNACDLGDAETGERVDLLIAPADDPDEISTILSIKSKKKVKPLKMGNFNTLVGHMIKTRDRLNATLAEIADPDSLSDLREKIAWLDRGIDLFS
ncbi:MAG: hypothetical protein CVV42_20325 [Candidatus Riflebacteria bacterium HGW-Riflebacteria-2]|jgi:hypothetical protein|nr:MAG: hypothetical protein CVV42_20325 [Candidatus Riflebacteria bacterium HGW-Riflebacteria-2]